MKKMDHKELPSKNKKRVKTIFDSIQEIIDNVIDLFKKKKRKKSSSLAYKNSH